MSRHRRFCDGAGFTRHCWECDHSTDWRGGVGRCGQCGIVVDKYDSPNNGCSKAGGCGYYEHANELRGEASE